MKEELGWDDEIQQVHQAEWKTWLGNLPYLQNISVNRCFKPQGFGTVHNAELHFFSDGSELGYGACAYLRLADEHGNICCSFVLGKARVAPIKQMSIPRLELSGAVLACRLYGFLSDE